MSGLSTSAKQAGHIDKSLGCIAKSMTDDDGSTLIGFVTRRYQDGAVALAGGDVTAAAAAAAHLEFEVVGGRVKS